jgi:hypothetical protein
MIRFDGTVELVRKERPIADAMIHPSVDDESYEAWLGGYPDSFLYKEDVSGKTAEIEAIPLSGAPEGVEATAHVYPTEDGRYWCEVHGSVMDTLIGVFDNLEELWMRIDETDFHTTI